MISVDAPPWTRVWPYACVVLWMALMLRACMVAPSWIELARLVLVCTLAATLPSCGAPVAGGIVLLPAVQRWYGLRIRDAVAFCSSVQFFGCGIFTPLNWWVRDPHIFLVDAWRDAWMPSTTGMILGFFALVWDVPYTDRVVLCVFTLFSAVVLVLTTHRLMHARPTQTLSPLPKGVWSTSCVVGGALTACVGIALEKTLFVLLASTTRRASASITVTSITAVGWASGLCLMVRACDPVRFGRVPLTLTEMALPGILLGATIGPVVHARVGDRPVLWFFVATLVVEVVANAHRLAFDL